MNATRIIKKYPNRRLYDTQQSRYITIEDVLDLVLRDEPLVVIDNQTDEALTRSILLQLLMQLESREEALFSEELLARLIRARSSHPTEAVRECLERSLSELEAGEREPEVASWARG